jgi:hypothetical protein
MSSHRSNIVLKNATETRTASPSMYKINGASTNTKVNEDGSFVLFTRYLDVVMIPGKAIQKVEIVNN